MIKNNSNTRLPFVYSPSAADKDGKKRAKIRYIIPCGFRSMKNRKSNGNIIIIERNKAEIHSKTSCFTNGIPDTDKICSIPHWYSRHPMSEKIGRLAMHNNG